MSRRTIQRCTVSPKGQTAKQRFTSRQIAIDVATKRALKQPGIYLRAYRCPDCEGWHLTKQPLIRS